MLGRFAGIVIMALTLTLEDARVDEIYDFLSELFSMPEDFDTFLREQFIPKVNPLYAQALSICTYAN